jgi:biofilm protein TabA
MLSTKIGLEYKYDFTAKKFQLAFEFLKRRDLAELEPQSIELGEGVRANIQRYDSFEWDANRFETHEKFFDIQYVIEGVEYCGVCEREGLKVAVPYNPVKDVTFYEDPELYGKVLLKAGDYIVVGPEDVHKPRCAAGKSMPIKKVVIKVPV